VAIYPNGKNEWIAAMKNVHKRDGKVFAGHLQDKANIYMNKASGFSAIGIKLCMQQDLTRKKCDSAVYGTKRKSLTQYALFTKGICRSTPHTRWVTMPGCSQQRCVNSVLGPTPWLPKAL
jgi:hypothetical protein